MSWSHDYWPRDQHEYLLELVRADHGGVLPDWAIAADLVYLSDLAQHPRHPQPRPGRRELERRWGTSERVTKAAIADVAWRAKAELAKVRVVDRERPRPRPASVPAASPPPSPPPTVEPEESSARVPAPVPVPVPPASPPPSPTRARSSSGPYGPPVLAGGTAPPSRHPGLVLGQLQLLAVDDLPLRRAVAEGALRLLDGGHPPPSTWRVALAEQAAAQERTVVELARRAQQAGLTPPEVLDALGDWEGRWFPSGVELVRHVRQVRAAAARAEEERQLALPDDYPEVDLEAVRATRPEPPPVPPPRPPEPPPVLGRAALEEARRRRAAVAG